MTVHDPDLCLCIDCTRERHGLPSQAEETEYMRSFKPKVLTVDVVRGKGVLPAFLLIFHRHFEKAMPTVLDTTRDTTLTAPLDMLDMMTVPESLFSQIASIEVVYVKDAS